MGKVMKSLKRFARNKKAISGLETAIVLIAFVIVASAFAYAVLNMGFLATQKSQQVVLGGLAAASSALVVDGPVYGYSDNPGPNGNMTSIIFWLKTASGASTVDLNVNKTTIGFQNPRGVWPNIYNSGGGSLTYTVGGITYMVANGGADNLNATTLTWEVGAGFQLVSGQKVRVTINLEMLTMYAVTPSDESSSSCLSSTWTSTSVATATPSGGTNGCQYAGEVMKNEEFYIIVKPPVGSVLEIDRVAPAAVNQVNDLG